MAPPVAPSPHRFLSKPRQRKTSPDTQQHQTPRPKPTPRPTAPRQTATPQRPAAPTLPSSQFASTPKFGLGRPKLAPPTSPPKASFANSLRPKRLGEDVEDDGNDDEYVERRPDGDEMLLDVEDGEVEVRHSIEQQTTDLPFSPKRRRIENYPTALEDFEGRKDAMAMPPPSTPVKPPTAICHDPTKAPTPRFVAPSATATTIETFRARPSFVNPSPAPAEAGPPLPEAFSPHRRGQKFVPGGMAAMVQQWVVETGQSAVQSRRGQGCLRGEDFVFKFRVKVVRGGSGGPLLVEGRGVDGEVKMVMLMGEGKGESVEQGTVVGIRAPTWEIEIDGVVWCVGVDWRTVT